MSTNTPIEPPRGAFETKLNFFSSTSDGEIPYSTFGAQVATLQKLSNIVSIPQVVQVNDMRGHESDFNLDVQGFEPIRGVSPLAPVLIEANGDFVLQGKEDLVKEHVEEVLHDHFEAVEYLNIFTLMLRSSESNKAGVQGQRKPSPLIHIDQTPSAGLNYVAQLPSHLQESVTKGLSRVRILSVWQPLVPAVLDWPLAMADARTCPSSALLDSETRLSQNRKGAMSLMRFAPGVAWWYWSGMTDEEILLIKNYDSMDIDSRTPHTSFRDPRVLSDDPRVYRKSVEARVVLVTKSPLKSPTRSSDHTGASSSSASQAAKESALLATKARCEEQMIARDYQAAYATIVDGVRDAVELYGKSALAMVPYYLCMAEVGLELSHMNQVEEVLALSVWNLVRASEEDAANEIHTLGHRARVCKMYGRYHSECEHFDEAVKQAANGVYYSSLIHGPEHIETSTLYFTLGVIFQKMFRTEEALGMFDKVVEIWYKHLMSISNQASSDENVERDRVATPPIEDKLCHEGITILAHVYETRAKVR
ncbi:unnamed protein product [Aphanomyces euteiches]